MKRRSSTVSRALRALVLAAVLAPMLACDPFEPSWFALEDFAVLYSLSRAEYIGRESGYDFISQVPVVVERPKTQNPFDFDILVLEIGGVMHVMPSGMIEGFDVRPSIQRVTDQTFEALETAPRDGYVEDETMSIQAGDLFAVRTRRDARGCHMFGKFEIMDVSAAGVVELRALRNPLCNDRNLVPPDL